MGNSKCLWLSVTYLCHYYGSCSETCSALFCASNSFFMSVIFFIFREGLRRYPAFSWALSNLSIIFCRLFSPAFSCELFLYQVATHVNIDDIKRYWKYWSTRVSFSSCQPGYGFLFQPVGIRKCVWYSEFYTTNLQPSFAPTHTLHAIFNCNQALLYCEIPKNLESMRWFLLRALVENRIIPRLPWLINF